MSVNVPENFVLIGSDANGNPIYVKPEPVHATEVAPGFIATSNLDTPSATGADIPAATEQPVVVALDSPSVSGRAPDAVASQKVTAKLLAFVVANRKVLITLIVGLIAALSGLDLSGLVNIIQ
jgi:hypothetical protein